VLLLLDTHAWIWSAAGDTRQIGRRARQAIARSAARDEVRISAATLFELAALHAAGRLRLTRSPDRWVHEALEAGGARLAPVSADVALDAGTIPRDALADPLDRLLVATARQLDATFLTADARILDYAASTRNVRVQHAGR
jgi:PIN domain nuclease of toxin-antitoxin system